MDNKENLVTEEVTENVENTTEEIPQDVKTYTQEEVDVIVGKAKARTKAKIEKENNRKYGGLIDTLKAGTGTENVDEIADAFKKYYQGKGVDIPAKADISDRDIEVLARADADELIRAGYDEVVEELDRLTELGTANMSPREKAAFRVLAQHQQSTERTRELARIGVTKDVYNSKAFQDFASKFTSDTPIRDIYDIYSKTLPKKEFKTMGSMKQSPGGDVKDYYSPEEIERLTEEDLDDPKVWEAVRRSMTGR